MELEHGVCTIKQAREFDKYGLKLNSNWAWVRDRIINKYRNKFDLRFQDGTFDPPLDREFYEYYPAYSCAELWKILLNIIRTCEADPDGFQLKYLQELVETIFLRPLTPVSHVVARAIIHLLEDKIVHPDDLTLENK